MRSIIHTTIALIVWTALAGLVIVALPVLQDVAAAIQACPYL